ncbi:MAG: single-stranded DNA-binding protein [Spirulinaceae cyanobacterium]
MNMNNVSLTGRLGSTVEVKYFESGTVLAKGSLAVDSRFGGKDAPPHWFAIDIWGKLAEVAANYTDKGSLIGIEGELRMDTWQDKETKQPRCKPVIRVKQLHLLDRSPQSQSQEQPQNPPTAQSSSGQLPPLNF